MESSEKTPLFDDAEPELRLGELLIKEGLLSESQLEEALRLQARQEPRRRLGKIVVERNFVSQQQLNFVLDWYYRKYRLGEILTEANVVTPAQLEVALHHHRRTGLRLGDALRQLEFLTEEQLKRGLCTQFGATYVDLDKLVIGPGVAELVDKEFAQLHRVVPVGRTEGGITVAVADPADSGAVEELRANTGCRINVLTSTDAGFSRAFRRVYGESPEVALARQLRALQAAYETLQREHEEAAREIEALRTRLAASTEARQHTTEGMERVLGQLRRLS